jgi:hypothetical protein
VEANWRQIEAAYKGRERGKEDLEKGRKREKRMEGEMTEQSQGWSRIRFSLKRPEKEFFQLP